MRLYLHGSSMSSKLLPCIGVRQFVPIQHNLRAALLTAKLWVSLIGPVVQHYTPINILLPHCKPPSLLSISISCSADAAYNSTHSDILLELCSRAVQKIPS